MPDTVSALDTVARMPNLGLCSIAGNLENCEVREIDLVFHHHSITDYVKRLVEDYQPDLIGLSAMTHQYASACRIARICRQAAPGAKIALGGYHATLMHREIAEGSERDLFDFVVRGEGEIIFAKLVQQWQRNGAGLKDIPGLSYQQGGQLRHNEPAELCGLDSLKLPDRSCRILDKAEFLGQSFDCVETSRGCTMGCHFCSIGQMYGRNLRTFALERVINDLSRIKANGKKGVFFVDDNITLDVPRLKQLCEMIVGEKLNTMSYIIQASVPGIASDPELAPLLKKAGFEWVFLGIESGIARNLQSMGKHVVLNNTQQAVSLLREQGIGVFGGFIIANPEDTREDIRSTFRFALDLKVDHPIMQCLTPYPKTETRNDLAARHLITNPDDFTLYNGFTCNVRTEHLATTQINRAIFWGGLRLYFNPGYLARSRFWHYRLSTLPALLANNFRYLGGALRGRIFISRHRW